MDGDVYCRYPCPACQYVDICMETDYKIFSIKYQISE